MFLELRHEGELEYFRKMIRYSNMIQGAKCLHIDFFWNFSKGRSVEQEREEAEQLVDLLLTANAYKKLTIGSDGL